MKKNNSFISILTGITWLSIAIFIIVNIFRVYKHVFINYCLYNTSNMVIPPIIHFAVSGAIMFPLSMVLLPVLIIALITVRLAITKIVKRK